MGLDQYIFAKSKDATSDVKPMEIYYWRKHNALQGLMEKLWSQDHPGEDFNMQEFELDMKLLTKIRTAIENKELKPADGFFWGNTDYDPATYMEEDLDAMNRAENALLNGLRVYYWSWY